MPEKCKYESLIDGWCCPEEAHDKDGYCIFHSRNIKDPDILKERFEARLVDTVDEFVRLDGAVFVGDIPFKDRVYEKSISFENAEFSTEVSFDNAVFKGEKTVFDGVHFKGCASFKGVQFQASVETSFTKTNFYKGFIFDHAKFYSKKTSFCEARFDGGAGKSFKEIEFHSDETSFESATFLAKTSFHGTEPNKVFLGGCINFKKVKIGIPGQSGEIEFKWANLSKTEFLETDLSKITFLEVTWDHRYNRNSMFGFGLWRSRLFDEEEWHIARKNQKAIEVDEKYLFQLSQMYRALKDYYKKTGENQLVGHFNYGWMEVLLHQEANKQKTWIGRKVFPFWLKLYKVTSGFGEDYALAIILLLLSIFYCGVFYWYWGVPSANCESLLISKWEQFANSLLYSFQAATLSRVEFYKLENLPLAARCIHLVESIFVPAQFAFFIIALRNRYRR